MEGIQLVKTPAAPIVGMLMEKVTIDIGQVLTAFHALQERVEHVIVEGVGGWLVPIRSDYFVSDLAAADEPPGCRSRAKPAGLS